MGELPGEARLDHNRKFHDKDGNHRFPHPSTYEPRRSGWNTWERRYAAHLDRHAELAVNPEPMDGDPQVVTALFDHIEHLLLIVEKEKKLILALREKQAAGAEPDDKDIKAIRTIIRLGGQ
jgi:hypothetical protein